MFAYLGRRSRAHASSPTSLSRNRVPFGEVKKGGRKRHFSMTGVPNQVRQA
jgi:hypothetical protein